MKPPALVLSLALLVSCAAPHSSYLESEGQPDAARGRALMVDIVRENGIDEFYINGRGSTFYLPEVVWPELTDQEKRHVRAYVASKSRSYWALGLGRLFRNEFDGRLDILSDRIIEDIHGPREDDGPLPDVPSIPQR